MAKKSSSTPPSGGIKGFLSKAYNSFAQGASVLKTYGWWAAEKSGQVGFILATTSIVVFMPLIFELVRETQSIEIEKSQVKDLRSQGYTDPQLREMGFCEVAVRPPSVAMKR